MITRFKASGVKGYPAESGIPGASPRWQKVISPGFQWDGYIEGDSGFFLSGGDIYKTDAEGDTLWTALLGQDEAVGNRGGCLALGDGLVFAGWCVLDQNSGELRFSLAGELGLSGRAQMNGSPANHYLPHLGFYRYSRYLDQAYCINTQTLEVQPFFLKGRWLLHTQSSDAKQVLGVCVGDRMGLIDLERQDLVWEKNLSEDAALPVSCDKDYFYCIASGWKGISKTLLSSGDSQVLVSEAELRDSLTPREDDAPVWYRADNKDYLYVSHGGRLAAFHKTDGGLLFETEAYDQVPRCTLLKGDLLFVIGEKDDLWAIDALTGKTVWRANCALTGSCHLMAAGNYIYLSSTSGLVQCYEWQIPYISPAR